jgi:Calx-beta domain/Matrixin/IPT/TIG domain
MKSQFYATPLCIAEHSSSTQKMPENRLTPLLLKKAVTALAILLSLLTYKGYSQCMLVPVSLDQRVQQSALVVEGVVTGQRSLWDDRHHNIYTIYTVGLTSVFKGNPAGTTLQVLTKGGQVGNQRDEVTNNLEAWNGKAGIFTLIPASKPVTTGSALYECYAGVQGLISYDPADKSAVGVFDRYESVEQTLYPLLEAKTGSRRVITPFKWSMARPQGNAATAQVHNERPDPAPNTPTGIAAISGFSPTSATAGTLTVLTITGTSFGSTQGSSYVQFKNADNGGTGWTTPLSGDYISWSDTQIQIYVPYGAGTGQIRVVTGTTSTSTGSLTVPYNITNVNYNNTNHEFPKLYSDNGSGGYTFSFFTDFSGTSAATYFTRAMADWNCNSGVNFRINASTTTIDVAANDGTNVVRFDNGSELSAGVLGQATVRSTGCTTTSWYVSETDMVFDDGTNWYYGTGTPSATQYDFYSVALHEMGHAHLQGHTINSGTMMHYSIGTATTARSFSATQETAGGAYVMTQSTGSSNCFTTAMSSWSACTTPTVTLTTGATSIAENGGSTTVTATLSAMYLAPVTVTLSTSGTATSGTDYSLSATTITIPAGSTSASVTLTSIDDAVYEGSQTVIIDISGVTNGTESGTQQRTVTITDNESGPTVSISSSFSVSTEGGSGLTITATQSTTSSLATTVNFSFSGTAVYGTDYTMNASMTIPAGSTSVTTTLVPTDDALDEPTETIIIDISSVTNGTENGTQQLNINLNDNDSPPSVTLSSSTTTIAEAAGSSTITATLSAVSGQDVTVTLTATGTATGGTDYTIGTTSIVIPAGSSTGTTTVTAIQDALDEANETVILNITGVTNGSEFGTQVQTITITDDDASPTVTLSFNNASIGETATSTSVFTATLSAVSGLAVTVNLGLSNTATYNTDYSMSTLNIVIPAGSTTGTATLTVIPDALYEGNEYVTADISTVTNGTENGVQQQTLTINDDDAAPTVTLASGASGIAETGGSTTVTATLSAASGLATTVNLSFSGTAITTTDYTLATSITIPAGSTSASITLSSVSDALDEMDETVIIDISSVTNAAESGTQQQTVTITDDDAAPTVTLSTGAASIAEAAGSTTVTATLSAASGQAVMVTLSLSGTATVTTDYTLATTITIPAGSTSASATVTAVQDALDEDDETLVMDILGVTNATENGTQQRTVTITDDDAQPTATIAWTNTSIGEGPAGTSNAVVTLSAVSARTVTINLTWSGNATLNTDYTVTGSTITIPAGSTSGFVTMNNLTDNLYEGGAENIGVTIASATNATIGNPSSAFMTQNDDDAAPTVTLSSSSAIIGENGGTATITVTQSAVSGLATTITITRSGTATSGTDYTLSSTSLSIPAGSTSVTATVTAINDAVSEGDETVILDITAVTNGTESGTQQQTIIITEGVVPVKFTSFTATAAGCKTNISFSTELEQNSNRFEAEWSTDGSNWTSIATIASRGNSSTTQTYSTIHSSPAAGNNYYRIKQVDNDGKATYTNTVIAKLDCSKAIVSVSPNPFTSYFLVNGIMAKSTIQLFDARGALLLKKENVNGSARIDAAQLPQGGYILLVTGTDGTRQHFKVVKQ